MDRFRISLNTAQHTIGVDEPGVLTAIVCASVREADDLDCRRRCTLELGALDSTTGSHFDWPKYELQPGDTITIEVLRAGLSDPPSGERRLEPDEDLERKKEYVRHLAKEFGWKLIENEQSS